MDFLQALILSVVEGVTEFLPISSTGHLILASKLLNISQTDFTKSFEIIIQSGAILAVVVLYLKELLGSKQLFLKVVAGFLPTAFLGLVFYKVIKTYLLGNLTVTLASLFLGGLAIIFLEKFFTSKQGGQDIKNLTFKNAFLIGLYQSISMIPGVSRSAATILGGILTGLDRTAAVKFSFMLAIPTMLAATGLDLLKSKDVIASTSPVVLGIGLIGSFVVALVVVKWFLGFVQKSNLIPFGIYRIIIAVIFYLVFLS